MQIEKLLLASVAVVAAIVLPPIHDTAFAQTAAALSGQVSSAAEAGMEGVLVSAKRDGTTITVTVVSDDKGRYSFPASRLEPGHYMLSIRAVGYDLDGPKAADVTAGTTTTADIRLLPTRNVSAQLTNTEWVQSVPGTAAQKKIFLNCTGCHTLERIVKSSHDAAGFLQVFDRMSGYYPGSMPIHPQRLSPTVRRNMARGSSLEASAQYLATINLSQGETRSFPLKTLPRPSGRATHVVITQYDLPRPTIEPHDVVVGADGTIWYSSFGEQVFGKVDPKTGKVTEYPVPVLKKDAPTGTQDLEFDANGNLWVALMTQVGFAKFDPRTEALEVYPVPSEWQNDSTQTGMVSPVHSTVDGKVWGKLTSQNALMKLDVATGKYEVLNARDVRGKNLGSYGIPSDRDNNLWLLNFDGAEIGKVDAKSGLITVYPTPTPGSRPRRGQFDAQNRLWFGEFGANAIGMFDPRTETFKEWTLPTEWSAPYDAAGAKNGDAWTGSMFSDRVARLDVRTNRFVEYLLPRSTNIRRVFVDDANALWIGNNHGAEIVKVEPLD
jgi:virginiamycin B lyase